MLLLGTPPHDNPLMAMNLGFYKVSLDIDAILQLTNNLRAKRKAKKYGCWIAVEKRL